MSEETVVTSAVLREWPLPEIGDNAGKQARGTVVVIGGAADTPGAVLLAGLAALRVGAGRLTVATVDVTAATLAVAIPEAAVSALPATGDGRLGGAAVAAARDLVDGADVVVLGPGMRGADEAKAFVSGLLPAIGDETTLVLDAMGLTCGAVTEAGDIGRLIATPNAKEARILLDEGADDERDVDAGTATRLAKSIGGVVALESHVAAPDGRCWVDGSGNSGLGTSGSGDVLAGAIGGLAARGATPDQAAVWGAHVHAEAGERLAARVGRLGYLARELLDELPRVLAELEA
ncbi:MAG: NAD(P)H-hydrate dehydratase [Frankiales bacterium]|nr:NAD(P)H-hydrate dehydratase [Frankiales bacterium]